MTTTTAYPRPSTIALVVAIFAAASVHALGGGAGTVARAAPPTSIVPIARPLPSPETARLDADARAPATDVRIAPSTRGVLGAWLVCGPFKAGKPALDAAPAGGDANALSGAGASAGATCGAERTLGAAKKRFPPARWTIASSSDAPVDVKAALDASAMDLVAYAFGSLHVERPGKHLLLLSVDDGVRVSVDGKVVFTRDDGRPMREDDDVVPLDLAAGDHELLLKLHQRAGAWIFRARLVDPALAPPLGAYLRLPGTTADDARALAGQMAVVSVERRFDASIDPPRYEPSLAVRYPSGAPRGVPLAVTTRLVKDKSDEPVFDLRAGGVPVAAAGVSELVVTLPPVAPSSLSATLETTVAGRAVRSPLPARPASEAALARLVRALGKAPKDAAWLPDASRVSAEHLARRMERELARGDLDAEAQADEAKDLDRLAAALEKQSDPYDGRTGLMRRAIRSSIDGEPTEFGLYVPPWYKPARRFPLVVGLHGLNGRAMEMQRWIFGFDDPKHDGYWEDRHPEKLPPTDAFVVTPLAHGNTLYRELGETDVMQILAWVTKTYAIDPTRVTITGPSMGGIGSASIPLHFPHVFAGAMPLCGYHSYLIRSDVAGRPMRPWERFLAEERSNVLWAENGEHLPLFVVHGTEDKPEENSGVLIERYEKLKFSITHEHPESGHNVWQETYEDQKGLAWLMNRRLDPHPARVRFKTTRTRWSTSAWVTIDELTTPGKWAEVDARASKRKRVAATTSNVAALTFARDDKLFDEGPIAVDVDGQSLAFDEGEPLVLHREGSAWKKGAPTHDGVVKSGRVTGPIRDVFYEPILFVWADGDEARANEEVARSFAKIRGGVFVSYPIMSDTQFFESKEPLANDRALFLVGRTNKVLAALAQTSPMPIEVLGGAVNIGKQRITGNQLGAAFVRPNPARPDRYVVVVAGADAAGTLRATSLPDLIPDFVVWDEGLAPSRGQVLLGAGSLRAGGDFQKDWSLPATFADPLARAPRRPVSPAEPDEQDAPSP